MDVLRRQLDDVVDLSCWCVHPPLQTVLTQHLVPYEDIPPDISPGTRPVEFSSKGLTHFQIKSPAEITAETGRGCGVFQEKVSRKEARV